MLVVAVVVVLASFFRRRCEIGICSHAPGRFMAIFLLEFGKKGVFGMYQVQRFARSSWRAFEVDMRPKSDTFARAGTKSGPKWRLPLC